MVAMRIWRAGKKQSVKSGRRYGTTLKAFSEEQAMLQQFEFAKVAALEALQCESLANGDPQYVGAAGGTYYTLIERFVHAVSDLYLSGSLEPEVMKAVRFTGRRYSRSAKKELNRKAKTQHKAWMSTMTLAQTASGVEASLVS